MFCENCGNKLKDDDVFCPECGAKIIHVAPAEPDESPTVAEAVAQENMMEDVAELMAEESLSKSVEEINPEAPEVPDVPEVPEKPETPETAVIPEVTVLPEIQQVTFEQQPQPQPQATYQQPQPQPQATYQQPQQAQTTYQQQGYQQPQGAYHQSAPAEKKPVSKGLIIGIVILVLAIIGGFVAFMLFSNRKSSIDVTEYYTIYFDGTEPEGYASAEFDSDKFIEDNKDKIRSKKASKKASEEDIAIEFIRDCDLDSYSLDKSDGLSNGDEVILHVDIDAETALKDYNVKLTCDDVKKKVEGLSYYITKTSQLTDQMLSEMKNIAESELAACIDSSFTSYATDSRYEFLGTYILYPKKDSGYTTNRVVLVHKYSVALTDLDWSGVQDAYWYTLFDDVMVDNEGTFNFDGTSFQTPKTYGDYFYVQSEPENNWWGSYFYFYGTQTLNELYERQVLYYMESYEHDDAVTDMPGSLVTGPISSPREEEEEEPEETETDDAEEATGEYDGILIPDILDRKLTKDEIEEMDYDDIQTVLNDLNAICGYVFTKKTELNDYYAKFDWYTPEEGNKANEKVLGKIGYKNYQALTKERKRRDDGE